MDNNKVKVLLAEDDINLGSPLEQYLDAKKFKTDLFPDGEKAIEGFKAKNYDICILDVMMPKKDGFAVATEIRLTNKKVPIIFLTAKTLKEDVLEGFKLGADDYITKPFNMEELIFRIEAVLRRAGSKPTTSDAVHLMGKLAFHVKKQILSNSETNEKSKLTTKESELLKLLCSNMNEVLPRDYALKEIWKDDNYFNARSMDVYITKLRKHLRVEPKIQIINSHGKGYKLIVSE